MKRSLLYISLILPVLGAFPSLARAQQAAAPVALNDQQVLGRRIFQQRCAVCHTQPYPGARRYGPALHKVLVNGNEDMIHQFIMSGSKGKMPAFKYTLESKEIDAIVEFLKTLPPPAPPKADASDDNQQVD